MATFAVYKQVFASRRMLAMLLLGFASGLPLALSGGALQAWLTVEGVDIKTIGVFALVGLPYTFKFVWAPLMDRFEPRLGKGGGLLDPGRRRGWLMLTQLALAAVCFFLGFTSPKVSLAWMGALATALAFLSASQDIVFDAYRNDLLEENERGAGAALSVLGYRLAMLVSGGLALIIADTWVGWANTYRAFAVLFALFAVVTWAMPRIRGEHARALQSSARAEWTGFVAMVAAGVLTYFVLKSFSPSAGQLGRWPALLLDTAMMIAAFAAAFYAARSVGFPSLLAPWDAFFSRKHATALLALIVLYKLGDAFAGALSTTFLIRGMGFSQAEVGTANKLVGLIASIAGALLGGAWLAKRSLFNGLMLFGALQAISNLAYWALSVNERDFTSMAAAVALENLCGGMGTAAFVALMMSLTDARFSAAQYALLSALSAVGRVYVGPASGVMVEAFGWPQFFLTTVVTALPGLLLLWWLRPTINSMRGASVPAPLDD
jgi:MFS transporter, PAT family, beta-lactamase induction signal transducer AmpG